MESPEKLESALEKFLYLLPRSLIRPHIVCVGYGNSADAVMLRGLGYKVCGTDISYELCLQARAKGIAMIQADCARLPFTSGLFHGIWAKDSLTYIPKRKLPTILRRFYSLLRQGGILFLRLAEGEGEEIRDSDETPITSPSWTYGEINMLLERCNLAVHEIRHLNGKEPILEIVSEKIWT